MPVKFDQLHGNVSWEPNWSTTWMSAPCDCSPATYEGIIPYYDPNYYSPVVNRFLSKNLCISSNLWLKMMQIDSYARAVFMTNHKCIILAMLPVSTIHCHLKRLCKFIWLAMVI